MGDAPHILQFLRRNQISHSQDFTWGLDRLKNKIYNTNSLWAEVEEINSLSAEVEEKKLPKSWGLEDKLPKCRSREEKFTYAKTKEKTHQLSPRKTLKNRA